MYFLLTEEDEFRLDLRKLKLNPDYMISVMSHEHRVFPGEKDGIR